MNALWSLGLDVSTSVVGICILDPAGKVVLLDNVDLRKTPGTMAKAAAVRGAFRSLLAGQPQLQGCNLFIEQNLSGFRPGFSSAGTILTLARFNGIVSLIGHETFGSEPQYVDFTKARKALGIKTLSKKKCGVDVKEQIWNHVSSQFTWQWDWKVLKSGPRKGQRVLEQTQFDEADAWVVARSGLLHPDTIAG